MAILTTRRLRIEPFCPAHLDGLQAMNSDPEVMRYIGPLENRERTLEVIGRVQARWARGETSWWGLVEAASGELIGAGCVQHLRTTGETPDPAYPLEVGWRLRRERWHQGFATEAGLAMAGFAFGRLQAGELLSVCDPENTASAAVMRRLGMRYRGLEPWYGKPVATYAITADEWRSRPGGD